MATLPKIIGPTTGRNVQKALALKYMATLVRFPNVRSFFVTAIRLRQAGQIKKLGDLAEARDIQKLVMKFSPAEVKAYNAQLAILGFPTIKEMKRLAGIAAFRKADELADHPAIFGKEEVVLETLEEHIDHLRQESFFQQAHREAKKQNILGRSPEAREWYHDYALQYGTGYTYTNMLKEGGTRVSRPMRGKMMFFRYRPTLPTDTYDLYPLIFVLNRKPGYFDGINFHHLTPKLRAVALGEMFSYLNNLDFDISTELKFRSFRNIISNNKKFKFAKASLRRYNYSDIQSKIIEVHPLDWELAIMVETSKFFNEKGSRITSQKLWKETRMDALTN